MLLNYLADIHAMCYITSRRVITNVQTDYVVFSHNMLYPANFSLNHTFSVKLLPICKIQCS